MPVYRPQARGQDEVRDAICRSRQEFARDHAAMAGLDPDEVIASMETLREHRDIKIRASELPDGWVPAAVLPHERLILHADGSVKRAPD